MEEKIKVLVSGRVQGIGYRAFVDYHAKKLGLKGYVKNLHDGRVEAVFQGDNKKVEKMLSLLKKHPLAIVNDIQIEKVSGEFDTFEIRY